MTKQKHILMNSYAMVAAGKNLQLKMVMASVTATVEGTKFDFLTAIPVVTLQGHPPRLGLMMSFQEDQVEKSVYH